MKEILSNRYLKQNFKYVFHIVSSTKIHGVFLALIVVEKYFFFIFDRMLNCNFRGFFFFFAKPDNTN